MPSVVLLLIVARGGSRFSGKGVVMYKGLCVWGVALLILSIFLKYPMKIK